LSRSFGHGEKSRPIIELLKTVNRELDRAATAPGGYTSPLKPAPLPVGRPLHLQDTLLAARSWMPIARAAVPAGAPKSTGMCLRGLHTFVFAAEKGDRIEFDITNIQLGHYLSPTAVDCYRPDGSRVSFLDIPLHARKTVAVTADAAGAWVLAVTSHNNAFRVLPLSRKSVLYSPAEISGCTAGDQAYRYFFYVPRQTRTFRLRMAGCGGETATFRVFAPDDTLIVEEKDLGKEVTRRIDARPLAGAVWRLDVSDIVEDHGFQLMDIPNIFAARPDQLLVPQP